MHFPYPGVLHQITPLLPCLRTPFSSSPWKTPPSVPFFQGPCLLDDNGMKVILLNNKLLINYQFLGTPCLLTILRASVEMSPLGNLRVLICGVACREQHASTRLNRAPSRRLPPHLQLCWACQDRAIQALLYNHTSECTFPLEYSPNDKGRHFLIGQLGGSEVTY